MKYGARALGHPVHPMIVAFPLGLLGTAVVFDIIGLIENSYSWFRISFWMFAAGIIGGLLAAVFGLVDWLAVPARTRAKQIGLYHAVLNVAVVVLFAASWFLRKSNDEYPTAIALALSFTAACVSVIGAWLGGELIYRLGIGVDPGANPNAPNSLTSDEAVKPRDYSARKAS